MTDLLGTLRLRNISVAEYVDGSDLPAKLAPRPYLHPIRTLGGTVVTDALPADHPWHLGLSMALQDVDGWNFWGGPTFVGGQGYIDRDDHGRIEHANFAEIDDQGFLQRLYWRTTQGETLLVEDRQVRARLAGPGWELTVATTLTNATARPVRLGSPGSNGRPGAGYGGLFWRLPPTRWPSLFTDTAAGEVEVHDTRAPWLAWTDQDRGFTLVLAGADGDTRRDPWFSRIQDYTGVGSQLAASQPMTLSAQETVTRRMRALLVDGTVTVTEAGAWAAEAAVRQ